MQRLKVVFLILGLVLLVYAIHSVGGLSAIALSLLQMRWWLLLAILSTFVTQLLRTLAWSRVVDSYGWRVSFVSLWRVRLIGEALNYLSFAGPFLGDPAKAWLLSSETGFKRSGATVAFDRYLYSISTVLFIAAVATAWFAHLGIMIVVGVTIAVALSPFWIARYSRQIPPSRMYAVVGLHLFSHLFMVLEVAIILRGLNIDVTLLQTFFVEAVTKGMNGLFFFVPAQIGVSEGSHAALLHYLKIAGATGLTLGIARRVRSLFWSVLGLALLLKSRLSSRNGEAVAIGNYGSLQISE
jgi:hypothetical protein